MCWIHFLHSWKIIKKKMVFGTLCWHFKLRFWYVSTKLYLQILLLFSHLPFPFPLKKVGEPVS